MKKDNEISTIQKFTIVSEFKNSESIHNIVKRFNITYQKVHDVIREYVKEPYIILESKINTHESKKRSDGDA